VADAVGGGLNAHPDAERHPPRGLPARRTVQPAAAATGGARLPREHRAVRVTPVACISWAVVVAPPLPAVPLIALVFHCTFRRALRVNLAWSHQRGRRPSRRPRSPR